MTKHSALCSRPMPRSYWRNSSPQAVLARAAERPGAGLRRRSATIFEEHIVLVDEDVIKVHPCRVR